MELRASSFWNSSSALLRALLVEIDLAEQKMRHGQTWIDLNGLPDFGDGLLFEVLADHHLGEHEMGGGAIGRRGEHGRESGAGAIQIAGLQVADAGEMRVVGVTFGQVRAEAKQ